jgi:aldose 1-epimerase
MEYGATITSVGYPDTMGNVEELTLGFDTLFPYLRGVPFYGATVGRFANRIRDGEFQIDGEFFQVTQNEGNNHIHGGKRGFDKRVWKSTGISSQDKAGVHFSYVSKDGEEGFPGECKVDVIITVNEKDEITIRYLAESDKPTPVNMTNHTYWNLDGPESLSILDHYLEIDASSYLPVKKDLIPSGEITAVKNTPFDFRTMKRIGDSIDKTGGYDHCFVLDSSGSLTKSAALFSPHSGRRMEILSTQPGLQFYTGNFLKGKRDRREKILPAQCALCLETEGFPDSPNRPNFPSPILRPGEKYQEEVKIRFSSS